MTSIRWSGLWKILLRLDMGQEFGNFGLAESHKGAARVAQANARVARAKGQADKAKAYGQAARIELENKVAGELSAENMSRLRKEQRQAGAAVQAARAASGFTAEGSGSQPEISALARYEQAAQDMALNRSMQDVSSRFQSTMLRRSGDLAMMGAEADAVYSEDQAQIHKMRAHNANKAAMVTGTLSVVGAAVGAYVGGPAGAMQGYRAGAGAGSMYSAGLPGSMESLGGRNEQAEKDFAAAISKGVDSWLK